MWVEAVGLIVWGEPAGILYPPQFRSHQETNEVTIPCRVSQFVFSAGLEQFSSASKIKKKQSSRNSKVDGRTGT